jgi:hypothetical protein
MGFETQSTGIVHVIQLAVAPVFLLSGVGVTLTVLTNRLARIVDRARELEARPDHVEPELQERLDTDLATLSRRAKLVNLALTLSTTCALLVCLVIVALFVGALFDVDLSSLIAVLFVAAMAAFVGGLISFLREIFVATASLRIGRG